MGPRITLGSFLLLLGLFGGSVQEKCTDYQLQFERVYSVPGDMAMLNSTLLSPDVFNFTSVPYNISWYNRTGQELSNQTGRVLIQEETLWFLNLELQDGGDYVTILRTPSRCYRQVTKLVVEPPAPGECGRPRKAGQELTNGVHDLLSCPLKDYINKLNSYNVAFSIQWYRGCEPLEDGTDEFTYLDQTKLKFVGVHPDDGGSYTCTLTFTLDGARGSVSETIDAWIKEEYTLVPQVHEPANEIIKAQLGSSFSKRCQVFVPCVGTPHVDLFWLDKEGFIRQNHSEPVFTSNLSSWRQESPIRGVFMERQLVFTELKEEDFYINYTCRAYSDRGFPEGYFTLLPADPNLMIPIGSVLGSLTLLFIVSIVFFYLFKVDIVLCFRRVFPVLYTNKDLDGKLYDAYVVYPQPCGAGFSQEVEMFALHTLPEVLEKTCGYKLFIPGRNCLPGEALVDSVEENIQASRCLLLLYTASTFTRKHSSSSTGSNNNNISKSSENSIDNSSDRMIEDGSDGRCGDGRQHVERVSAMHRALLEGLLKVVLVEMEEVTPDQVALFPESVQHLRKKQGAVCWWKHRRTRRGRRTCITSKQDEEKGEGDVASSPSLSPSSRFWKELRYYMPVRGKRESYPEKTALLHL
ncbi:interleukin-1 receptor type 1-like isoform X2 [Genypterus blacodes]